MGIEDLPIYGNNVEAQNSAHAASQKPKPGQQSTQKPAAEKDDYGGEVQEEATAKAAPGRENRRLQTEEEMFGELDSSEYHKAIELKEKLTRYLASDGEYLKLLDADLDAAKAEYKKIKRALSEISEENISELKPLVSKMKEMFISKVSESIQAKEASAATKEEVVTTKEEAAIAKEEVAVAKQAASIEEEIKTGAKEMKEERSSEYSEDRKNVQALIDALASMENGKSTMTLEIFEKGLASYKKLKALKDQKGIDGLMELGLTADEAKALEANLKTITETGGKKIREIGKKVVTEAERQLEDARAAGDTKREKELEKIIETFKALRDGDFKDMESFMEFLKENKLAQGIFDDILQNSTIVDGKVVINDIDGIFRRAFEAGVPDPTVRDAFIINASQDFLNGFFRTTDVNKILNSFKVQTSDGERLAIRKQKQRNEKAAEENRQKVEKIKKEIEKAIDKLGNVGSGIINALRQNLFIVIADVVATLGPAVILDQIRAGGGKLLDALGGLDFVKELMKESYPEILSEISEEKFNQSSERIHLEVSSILTDEKMSFQLKQWGV